GVEDIAARAPHGGLKRKRGNALPRSFLLVSARKGFLVPSTVAEQIHSSDLRFIVTPSTYERASGVAPRGESALPQDSQRLSTALLLRPSLLLA
ncbi:unnamed protein product, partial [Prorocentrum cordatum]